MVSEITRDDGLPGSLASMFDDLQTGAAKGMEIGDWMCAMLTRQEVVKRCPVESGNLRECFADPAAVGMIDKTTWAFGLLTPELQRRGHYWRFVEFGTKGRPAQTRERINPKTGRRYRTARAATRPRPPQPFFRPGVAAARQKWQFATESFVTASMWGQSPQSLIAELLGAEADYDAAVAASLGGVASGEGWTDLEG